MALFAWWSPPPAPGAAATGPSAPLPAWVILPPGERRIVASGVYPPQPPYGAAATITYAIAETAEQFAAYEAQLAAAGYAVRRIPPGFNIAFDEPDLQLEADERNAAPMGGHVIYLSLRHTRTTRFAQLTFWDPPAPRLP